MRALQVLYRVEQTFSTILGCISTGIKELKPVCNHYKAVNQLGRSASLSSSWFHVIYHKNLVAEPYFSLRFSNFIPASNATKKW